MSNSKQLVRLLFGQPEPIEDCIQLTGKQSEEEEEQAEWEYSSLVQGIDFDSAKWDHVHLPQKTWYTLLYNRPDMGSRNVSMSMRNFERAARVILGTQMTFVSKALKSELFDGGAWGIRDQHKVVAPTNPFLVDINKCRKRQRDEDDGDKEEGNKASQTEAKPLRFAVTHAQLQSQRTGQEDRVVNITCKSHDGQTWRIWGVLDGHGGTRAVDTMINCWLPALPDLFHVRGWKMCAEHLEQALLEIDKDICNPQHDKSGGTTVALVVVVDETEAFVVHLGDSRIVFFDDQFSVVWATEDHRGSDPEEYKRIHAKGGSIDGLYTEASNYSLAMSRALGDAHMKCSFRTEDEERTEWGSVKRAYTGTEGLVVARASVARFTPSDFSKVAHVLAATDGVWDALAGYGELPRKWDEKLDIQGRIDASKYDLFVHRTRRSPSPVYDDMPVEKKEKEEVPVEEVKAPTKEEIDASEERRSAIWLEKLRGKIAEARQKQLDELTRLCQLWHLRPEIEAKDTADQPHKTDVHHLPSRLVSHCEQSCVCQPSQCYHADNKTVVLGRLPTKSAWGSWWL